MERKRKYSQLTTKEKQVTNRPIQVWKEASFSSLPMEILEHIFSFLHRDDLLQAMSVCTSWESLIFSSPNLWRSQTFIFDCTLHFKKKKKVEVLFCAQNFGPRFQSLSVKCRHPFLEDGLCSKIPHQFHLFLTCLIAPELTSFKVSDLQIECASRITIKKIGRELNRIFTKNFQLKVFEMPSAYWTKTEGRKLLNTVFQKYRNTLRTLNIADYFNFFGRSPGAWHWFSTGLTSLTQLTKLSITIQYLTDEIVVSLARTRRGQLAYLSLCVSDDLFPDEPHIQKDTWKSLTDACPNMEVKISMVGYFFHPHDLPAFFEPLELPVKKLKMIINKETDPLEIHVEEMDIVLEQIRNNYWEHLKSFKLEVYNEKKESFDQSLIKLVRDCPHLVHVEISVLYNSNDTAETIDKMIAERRPLPLTSDGPPRKIVCNDCNAVNIASRL